MRHPKNCKLPLYDTFAESRRSRSGRRRFRHRRYSGKARPRCRTRPGISPPYRAHQGDYPYSRRGIGRRSGIRSKIFVRSTQELASYDPELAKRPQVIAANKMDALYAEDGEIRSAPERCIFSGWHRSIPDLSRQRPGLKELLYYVQKDAEQPEKRRRYLNRNMIRKCI